jgi:CxxC-x17-CxxC domain-containing protein
MIITTLQLSAMERVRIPENERIDFFLYVDEFQNFATDSFANILSEARKYRLDLTIAHQYIGQLTTDVSTKVRDAVFGNVGTMVVFRVGAADGEFLEKEFTPEFGVQDLVNLPNRTICLKLMVDGVASRPFSASTLPPFHYDAEPGTKERAIEASRKRYARPQWQIEQDIAEWAGITSGGLMGGKFEAQCSHCGKQTYVPFEPTPGRPVYCGECLAKLKAGEINPARGGDHPPRPAPRKDPYEHLTALGIGVEDSIPSPRAAAREQLPIRSEHQRPSAPQSDDRREPRGDFTRPPAHRPPERKPVQPREQFSKPHTPLAHAPRREPVPQPPHRPTIFEKIGTEHTVSEVGVGLDTLKKNERPLQKDDVEVKSQKPFGATIAEHGSLAETLKRELQEALEKIKKES